MKIGIIVSGSAHLKTEQLALALSSNNNYEISLISVPFQDRKPRFPLFNHRPNQSNGVKIEELSAGLGIKLIATNGLNRFDTDEFDLFLIASGVLLPTEFIERVGRRVLNCHPGMIPQVRGLDAFKWAILEGVQVGNTLHYINGEVDMGDIVARIPTPVFPSDNLDQFAARHYAAEIRLLTEFEKFIGQPTMDANQFAPIGIRHMRMSAVDEESLFEAFENYKLCFASGEIIK